VELGGASEVVTLLEAGIPIAESQEDLTPYQRMVILKEMERRGEEQRKAAEGGGNAAPSSGGRVNKLRQPGAGGRSQGETVTFVNEHE
jgi:hypothetical protein